MRGDDVAYQSRAELIQKLLASGDDRHSQASSSGSSSVESAGKLLARRVVLPHDYADAEDSDALADARQLPPSSIGTSNTSGNGRLRQWFDVDNMLQVTHARTP